MKQLTSFLVLNVNGGDRISYTYDTINNDGEIEASNTKESFVVNDSELTSHVEAIRNFIRANRLGK